MLGRAFAADIGRDMMLMIFLMMMSLCAAKMMMRVFICVEGVGAIRDFSQRAERFIRFPLPLQDSPPQPSPGARAASIRDDCFHWR